MDYLSFNAATIANKCISDAIKRVEQDIEACGTLTHKDSKQSDSAKDYFAKQLEALKEDVEALRRFACELGKQAYHARSRDSEHQ